MSKLNIYVKIQAINFAWVRLCLMSPFQNYLNSHTVDVVKNLDILVDCKEKNKLTY